MQSGAPLTGQHSFRSYPGRASRKGMATIGGRRVLALFACALLCACAARGPAFGPPQTSQLITTNYAAADSLIAGSPRPIPSDAPVIVTTLMKLENINVSSNFGRLISEQIASRLTQLGYAVPELKLSGPIFVLSDEGELLLSPDTHRIAQSQRMKAVVVGTYAVGADVVYVHLELVEATNGHAISAYDYFLPMIPQVKVLLGLSAN